MPGFMLSRENAAIVLRALVREQRRLAEELAGWLEAPTVSLITDLEEELADVRSLVLVLHEFLDRPSAAAGHEGESGAPATYATI
jgi:hypothetical protein